MEELNWPKITKDTSIKQVKKLHRRIWGYVIKHGVKPETPYFYNCAACDYDDARSITDRSKVCKNCPIEWPENIGCQHDSSLYIKWYLAKNSFYKQLLAIRIYFIRFKKDV